ncbi:MAG TPA: DUF2125 domain-containing protein [Candidatus Sulfotelmatobacter sp.]|nr:DUF2125 domain-containing protein [Candidatus Sulfotelmatobacter sp.]
MAALASLLAGFCLWWGLLAYEMRQRLDDWVVQRRAEGWVVTTGSPVLGGFPFQVAWSLPSPSLQTADGSGWKGPETRLSLSVLEPVRFHLVAHGKHVLIPPGEPPQEAFIAEARAEIDGADAARLSLVAVEAFGGGVSHAVFTLTSQSVEADLTGLLLPEDARLLLGRKVAHLHVKALAKGALTPTLAAWRDGGGVMELSDIALTWEPLALTGEGTLALDKRMQPLFSGTVSIGGLFETLDKLTTAGAVRAKDAAMARIALQLLALPGPDGKPRLGVPVTVQDNRLYVGPVALMLLPDVEWPGSFYFRNE